MTVNYNSVAKKLRILAIKAIFDPKNPFLTNSIDDRMKIKAEISSFNMRYYIYEFDKVVLVLTSCDHQKSKLCAVADHFWVAELQVWQVKIGRKSCFGVLCNKMGTFWGEIFLGKIVFIEISQVSKYVRKKMKRAKLKLSKVIYPKYSKH